MKSFSLMVIAVTAACAALCLARPVRAAEPPAPASQLVDAAVRQAKASKKSVFVHFGATWCGWCKKLDAVLDDPAIQKTLAPHLVIVKLDVMEQPAKKDVENPGADKLLDSWGGTQSGLPFYVFLDASGKKIADSNAMPKNANIGFPATPEEIAAFEALLTKSAPRLGKADRDKIIARMKQQNAPSAAAAAAAH